MAKKKENILRKFAKDTFTSLPLQEEEAIKEERKGIREGTKGLSGARIIDISRIKSDPDQPRKNLNQKSLDELAESIKKHGLLQPITVEYIEQEDCFKIINGERRYKAAKLAGLQGLPKSYINEMLTLLKLPNDIKESVRTSDTVPKSLLLLLLRHSNKKNIRGFYSQIKEGKLTVQEAKTELKRSKSKKGRPKYYEYKFESPGREFVLKIKFRKPEVEQSEITNAIHQVLNSLNK